MVACAQLAALDFNSGVGLDQARNKKGELRYKHQFSKITQSWVAKKITEKKDKGPFRQHILDEVREIQRNNLTYSHPLDKVTVPSHIGTKEKPEKQETIKTLGSRFPHN